MAVPIPIPSGQVHQPVANGRPRVNSSRKSSYSTPLPPSVESPRTLCPRDSDRFSYNTAYLQRWAMDSGLLERLPHDLKGTVEFLQTAGAALLTGFERLEQHSGSIDIGPNSEVKADEMLVQLDDSISSLGSLPPRLEPDSAASSFAVLSSPSSGSQSPTSTSTSQPSQLVSPVSPVCLAADDGLGAGAKSRCPSECSRDRSFSTPLEPHNAYYVTELSHLRTESLPRLRHAIRQVQLEWTEVIRMGSMNAADIKEFQDWWEAKRTKAEDLEQKGMRLSNAIGLSPNGLGWVAP